MVKLIRTTLISLLFPFLILGATQSLAKSTEQQRNALQAHPQIEHIIETVRKYYVEDLTEDELFEAAMAGISEHLDNYSEHLNEKELDAMMRNTQKEYRGLGLEVELVNRRVIVVDTVPYSPAEKAGLESGDIIMAINHQPLGADAMSTLSEYVTSVNNGNVNLSIKRKGTKGLLEFSVGKELVNMYSVYGHFDTDTRIAYLKITSFRESTRDELVEMLLRYSKNFRVTLEGIVIDVRDNPGGLLDSAIEIADLFLDRGVIISTKGRYDESNTEYFASPNAIFTRTPITVLINNNTASAAEIVAVALKDNQRAKLLGTNSFGKGTVQSLIPLQRGKTAIKLTTAHYYSPNGDPINGYGVTPDEKISQEQDFSESALDPSEQTPIILSSVQGKDRQYTLIADATLTRAYSLIHDKK